jgi:hypothetical protein
MIKMKLFRRVKKIHIGVFFIFVLSFYAIGIATDFFASPILSTFFIISRETAHDIVFYASVAAAVVLTIGVLSTILLKNQRRFSPLQNRIVEFIKEANQESVLDAPALATEKIINISQVDGPQQKPLPQTTIQIPTDSNIEKITLSPNLFQEKEDKVFCLNCKKEVSIVRSTDNNSQKVGHEDLCPYCNKPLNSQSWLDEELWGKCFKL